MKLIGQYDSPFVRRVAVTLQLYGLPYEHRPWSAVGDADEIAAVNPLIRVPTFVTEDDVAFTDSGTILQFLDHHVGSGAFLSRDWPEQGESLRLAAFATGVADKAVALIYERAFHKDAIPAWTQRLHRQIADTLAMLEGERAKRTTLWLFGGTLSHADIILGTMACFLREAHPGHFDLDAHEAIKRHSEECEKLPQFRNSYRPFRLG